MSANDNMEHIGVAKTVAIAQLVNIVRIELPFADSAEAKKVYDELVERAKTHGKVSLTFSSPSEVS